MKRNLILLVALAALMFATLGASCPAPNPDSPQDPYKVARTTLNIMQATITGARVAFDGVVQTEKVECTISLCRKLHSDQGSQKYKDCLLEDHAAVPEYKACTKVGNVSPWVLKGMDIGLASCSAAKEAVTLAADLAQVRDDKKLKAACAGGDQKACDEYTKRVTAICVKVDPTKGEQYKLCVAGKPVAKADYSGISKKGACLAYAALAMVPANPKYDLYVNALKTWLRGYGGCS